MDRTGIIIALVQFILGFSEIEIIRDYNNSHSYIRQEQGVINVVFKIITEFGGIYEYLKYIGVSNEYINQIKNRFSNEKIVWHGSMKQERNTEAGQRKLSNFG